MCIIRVRCIDDSGIDRRRATLRKGREYEIDPRRDFRVEETCDGFGKFSGIYIHGLPYHIDRFEFIRDMDVA